MHAEARLQNPEAFLDQFADDAAGRVFAEPYHTPDGSTVIPVAKVSHSGSGTTAKPLGVFVIRDDGTTWVPAVDADRIALIGVVTGLVAATIGCLTLLRRPPWPDLSNQGHLAPHRRRFHS
ncbi:GerW family sporulation protein [Mycobacterium sp. SMC-18]|uniref:GerW family sporulation protein n=1 Tax=Mycobacterium sp. SMC-18 TaxID=3381629 RepID=UPI003876BA1B